jgi:hypothetical protein
MRMQSKGFKAYLNLATLFYSVHTGAAVNEPEQAQEKPENPVDREG